MNYKSKTKLDSFNKFLSVVLVIAIVFLVAAVAFNLGDKPPVAEETNGQAEDIAVIDEFKAGTYGGIEFASQDDVINFYKEAYDYTKTLTASYMQDGAPVTYYKLLGDESLNIENLLIEGSSNSMIDNLVPGIVGGLFTGGVNGLPPSSGRIATEDTKNEGKFNAATLALAPEDVLAANVADNGDGTITLTIQPKAVLLSVPGEDAQGKFFNTLGDISSVVESISVLSFSSGTIQENFVVNYQGGTGKIVINAATKEIVSGEYTMKVHIDVKHANVAVLKDKSASLDIVYKNNFPASDEYLASKGITRA